VFVFYYRAVSLNDDASQSFCPLEHFSKPVRNVVLLLSVEVMFWKQVMTMTKTTTEARATEFE